MYTEEIKRIRPLSVYQVYITNRGDHQMPRAVQECAAGRHERANGHLLLPCSVLCTDRYRSRSCKDYVGIYTQFKYLAVCLASPLHR